MDSHFFAVIVHFCAQNNIVRIIMKATYIKTQLTSVIDISRIVTIHYYEFDKSFSFKGERHNFWEMVYVDKGQVAVKSDEREIILSQGDIIFHRPNEFHSIRAYNSSPNFFVISFVSRSVSMHYFERYETHLDRRLASFISSIITEADETYVIPKNDTTLRGLVRRDSLTVGGEQLIKTYLEQLLIFLLRDMTKDTGAQVFPDKESMEHHLISKAKRFIEERVYGRVRVDELCSALGYSKSYLSRLFREQTGETISEYAIKKKIKLARQLIRDGEMNFAEISDRLSFDNPQYFSRVFKRVTGMTPTEYKESVRS